MPRCPSRGSTAIRSTSSKLDLVSRALLLAGITALVSACPAPQGDDYQIPGDDTTLGCTEDSQCGGRVCARTGECLDATEVRTVHVTWTVSGQPANNATCAN